ncbi:hypothetical protein Sulac_1753 [Sulfobacillus acidophilus DSM 10332]|uniref:Uncharacterized protein n=1 Tax=Sulfobacillus acidophilus (strain ATCC 700253 / DSM 10332 / NAL) TaxID=679936 RepID=G8TZK6_SULAD|nr:hypothetical protein Sulac_1753 [Sulfobacillus acidophilus DSM 10332]
MLFSTAWVAIAWIAAMAVGFVAIFAIISFGGQEASDKVPIPPHEGPIIPLPSKRARQRWIRQKNGQGSRSPKRRKPIKSHRPPMIRAIK